MLNGKKSVALYAQRKKKDWKYFVTIVLTGPDLFTLISNNNQLK